MCRLCNTQDSTHGPLASSSLPEFGTPASKKGVRAAVRLPGAQPWLLLPAATLPSKRLRQQLCRVHGSSKPGRQRQATGALGRAEVGGPARMTQPAVAAAGGAVRPSQAWPPGANWARLARAGCGSDGGGGAAGAGAEPGAGARGGGGRGGSGAARAPSAAGRGINGSSIPGIRPAARRVPDNSAPDSLKGRMGYIDIVPYYSSCLWYIWNSNQILEAHACFLVSLCLLFASVGQASARPIVSLP